MKLILLALFFCTSALAQDTELIEWPNFVSPSTVKFRSEFEGIYQIKLQCDPASPTCDPTLFKNLDRVTITDTRRHFGVWVTFASRVLGEVADTFTFTDVGPADNQISGYPKFGTGFGRNVFFFSYFEFTIDPVTADISGSIVFARNGSTYTFKGKKIAIARDFNRPAPLVPINLTEILGTYWGSFGASSGQIAITQLPDGNLLASYFSDEKYLNAPAVTFSFPMNTYDPVEGFLHLVLINQRFFTLGEMSLYVRKNSAGKLELDGFQYTGFANNPVKMVKIH
jgi:hypothetical protein